MAVESRLARPRRLELTLGAYRRLAVASAVSLYLIIISGAVVRLTASGLGCESWPGCEAGSFFPAESYHGWVEFGNRAVALLPITLSLATAAAAWRTPGVTRSTAWLAAATFLGTIAQAPLGLATIRFDLHPVLVGTHFLLALAVLATAVLVVLDVCDLRPVPAAPGWVRAAALAVVAVCAVVVTTGVVATMAGPHSGDPEVRRLGNLVDAVYVHVRATAVFGIAFAALVFWLARRRDPRLKLALAVLGLLLVQMAVGEIQWRTQLPWGVVLIHVALAAAVWAGTVALAARIVRSVRT